MAAEPSDVASRQQLAAFVRRLRGEYRANPEGWENNDLDRFLGALAAWVEDSPGYWANVGQPEPKEPDWAWVALSLRAATQYE